MIKAWGSSFIGRPRFGAGAIEQIFHLTLNKSYKKLCLREGVASSRKLHLHIYLVDLRRTTEIYTECYSVGADNKMRSRSSKGSKLDSP